MEFFHKSKDKAVRLKSHHTKFLLADTDGDATVVQHGNGNTKSSRWKVEFVPGATLIRLKNVATGLYLAVSDEPLSVSVTGKRVVQSPAPAEWAPVKEGKGGVMLRAHTTGSFLVANGTSPPWRNAVTHDWLCATEKVDWAVWVAEVVNEDPKKDLEEEKRMKRMVEKEKEDRIRRSYTVPAISFGEVDGDGKESPTAALRSARTMSPQRQKTLLSNSFHNRGATTPKADKPLPSELQTAQQALKEIQHLDFRSVFSSERLKGIESALSVFLSHTNPNNQRGSITKSKLLSIEHHLQTLKLEQKGGTNELEKYEDFLERKEYKMGELYREVGRARELEAKERKSLEVLATARRKREMLLREMEKVEAKMKAVEEEQEMNEDEMEILFRVIARKSEGVRTMERDESMLVKRKVMAERTIKEVESHWAMIKDSLLS